MNPRLVLFWGVATCATSACADLTTPSGSDSEAGRGSATRIAAAPQPAAADRAPAQAAAPAAGTQEPTIAASHIMVAFKGATGAKPTITRSKQAAKERAEQASKRARAGEDFAKLAAELSDGPSAQQGGQLGKLRRDMMTPAFSNAAFALEPGAVSDVVETQFGFHVIRRTQ